MGRKRRRLAAGAIGAALAGAPLPAAAQAFTLPRGVGAVSLAWQYVDNTGHRLSDGYFNPTGQSVTTSALLEMDYGVSDRLSTTLAIPYVFAKYTGANAPRSGLPVDTCRCWHSSFQDFSLSARYRLGRENWAITPLARASLPSHDYPFRGEAVVGKRLWEAQIGVVAGVRLVDLLPKASLQGGYTYAFVEKALDEVSVDRSNGFLELGYSLNRTIHLRAAAVWQHTHGGLRAGSPTGNPLPFPGELNTPERLAEADRLLRVRFWQFGGGLAYSAGPVDLFASYLKYVWGRDAHNGHVFGAGMTWYFGLPE